VVVVAELLLVERQQQAQKAAQVEVDFIPQAAVVQAAQETRRGLVVAAAVAVDLLAQVLMALRQQVEQELERLALAAQ
jgi:hypothetical protein